jgi:glycosyltransferase involved in cell wall biosynthesis
MKILFDLQSCQTASKKGGIGRYSMSLAREIITIGRGHDFYVLLNSLFPESLNEIRQSLWDILPPDHIKIISYHGPVAEAYTDNHARFELAIRMREDYIRALDPDFVLVTSLFEGLYENSVTSIGELGESPPTGVILYDLIPLVEQEKYLSDPTARHYYFRKLEYLKRADLALAISEFSRKEAMELIGLSSATVINISSVLGCAVILLCTPVATINEKIKRGSSLHLRNFRCASEKICNYSLSATAGGEFMTN